MALNPATVSSNLKYLYDYIDMILVMSVNPGFGGQLFIPETLEKLRDVAAEVKKSGKNIDIEVDGGVTLKNVSEIIGAGANVIVMGSSVFAGDIADNVRYFKGVFKGDIAGNVSEFLKIMG